MGVGELQLGRVRESGAAAGGSAEPAPGVGGRSMEFGWEGCGFEGRWRGGSGHLCPVEALLPGGTQL